MLLKSREKLQWEFCLCFFFILLYQSIQERPVQSNAHVEIRFDYGGKGCC